MSHLGHHLPSSDSGHPSIPCAVIPPGFYTVCSGICKEKKKKPKRGKNPQPSVFFSELQPDHYAELNISELKQVQLQWPCHRHTLINSKNFHMFHPSHRRDCSVTQMLSFVSCRRVFTLGATLTCVIAYICLPFRWFYLFLSSLCVYFQRHLEAAFKGLLHQVFLTPLPVSSCFISS